MPSESCRGRMLAKPPGPQRRQRPRPAAALRRDAAQSRLPPLPLRRFESMLVDYLVVQSACGRIRQRQERGKGRLGRLAENVQSPSAIGGWGGVCGGGVGWGVGGGGVGGGGGGNHAVAPRARRGGAACIAI